MTIFEYLMVLVSIIMGLGVTQVLRGASRIARGHKRDTALNILALLLFYLYVQNWWAMWDLNQVQEWNQAYFSIIIIMVCCLFGATELLLPMAATADTDWRAHLSRVRAWFYSMLLCFGVIATLETRLLLDLSLLHPYRIFQATILALMLAGAIVSAPRAQPWIAGSILGVILIGQVTFRLLPGIA